MCEREQSLGQETGSKDTNPHQEFSAVSVWKRTLEALASGHISPESLWRGPLSPHRLVLLILTWTSGQPYRGETDTGSDVSQSA